MVYHCEEAIKVIKWMMLACGVWPIKNPSKMYILRTIITCTISLGFYGVMIMQMIKVYNSYLGLSEVLYITLNTTAYVVKLYAFVFQQSIYLETEKYIYYDIFNYEQEGRGEILKEMFDLITNIAKFIRLSTCMCCSFFLLFPILENKELPIPFSYNLGEYTIYMYVFQIVGIIVFGWCNTSFDVCCSTFMAISAGQIDLLRRRLSTIFDEIGFTHETYMKLSWNDQTIVQEKIKGILKDCVKHHQAIISFTGKINDLFSFSIFIKYLATALVFCNSLFQIVLIVKPLTLQFFQLIFYCCSVFVELALYSWVGNELITKSSRLGEACYMSHWYNYDTSNKKTLLLIMERAQRPIAVTASKFAFASLESLVAILRWSYSTFALLKTMYSDE